MAFSPISELERYYPHSLNRLSTPRLFFAHKYHFNYRYRIIVLTEGKNVLLFFS